MTLPPAPKSVSVIAVVLAGVLLAAVIVVRRTLPPSRMLNNPRLDELRATDAQLVPYSDSAAQAVQGKVANLRARLWTEASFNRWLTDRVPKAWIVQQLGTADLKHLSGRRYAFQRPGATDADWPEIAAFLWTLEQAQAVSVQSTTLAVQPGYVGSRKFSQCLFIATFYFPVGVGAGPAP